MLTQVVTPKRAGPGAAKQRCGMAETVLQIETGGVLPEIG